MKSILVLLSLFSFSSLFSQSDYDERLLVKFSEDQIAQLQSNDSPSLDYWTYYLDHSYIIVSQSAEKNLGDIEEIKIKNLDKFNILESGLYMDRHVPKYYKIKGSDQMLVLLSASKFTDNYNESKFK